MSSTMHIIAQAKSIYAQYLSKLDEIKQQIDLCKRGRVLVTIQPCASCQLNNTLCADCNLSYSMQEADQTMINYHQNQYRNKLNQLKFFVFTPNN